MAERPSDEWFRSAGWEEHAGCWIRDYYDVTYIFFMATNYLGYASLRAGGLEDWADEAVRRSDPKALHAAWEAEQKRRETPLDPDGWTHLKNVGEHTSGYHYIRQRPDDDWFNVFTPDGFFFASRSPLEDVIITCNQNAKNIGVKT